VKCNFLAADVSRMSAEQQEPLYWLVRAFTAIGGEFWYGVTSGSDGVRGIGRRSWGASWSRGRTCDAVGGAEAPRFWCGLGRVQLPAINIHQRASTPPVGRSLT